MLELNFHEKNLQNLNVRDLMNFTRQMVASDQHQNKNKVYVNAFEVIQDEKEPQMVTVRIFFSVFKDKEAGKGLQMVWDCYRAKDFSCMSGVGFKELSTFKASLTIQALAHLYNTQPVQEGADFPSPDTWVASENLSTLDLMLFRSLCNY